MKTVQNFRVRYTIVTTLATVAVLLVFTTAVLALKGMPVPDQLDRMATGALGMLAGMMAKVTSSEDAPSSAENPKNEP